MKDNKEMIICSAIWYNDGRTYDHQPRNIKSGIVACGLRHCNCNVILSVIFPNRDHIINNKSGEVTIQGFLTNKGEFVNREDAGRIAFDADQTDTLITKLHSEDIF